MGGMMVTPIRHGIAAGPRRARNERMLRRMGIPLALFACCLCGGAVGAQNTAQAGAPGAATAARPIPPPEARIDINHASVVELMKVPGMTASWAGRIVRFRPYHSKQDLLERGVLPSDVYERIKDYVIAHRDKQ